VTRQRHLIPIPAFLLLVGLSLVTLGAAPAAAQCILANPSFELSGSGGAVFGWWNQFGTVGSIAEADHGQRAALVRGPGSGSWDVSAFWQPLDCSPGEQWQVTGRVRHPASDPLVGQNVALVNVEWRDLGGELIDYDSFTVADAGSPTDEYLDFSRLSGPAPAGTATIHLLVGVLQSPNDPASEVWYDQITCNSTTPPTIDDVQWNDFPGGRTITFAGRIWRVKGPGYYGPGPNVFSDAPDCVWVDDQQQLHLTLARREGVWTSTEVVLEDALGYGDYVVTTVGRLDLLDPEAVLGLFLWEYGPCWADEYTAWNAYNEIDIEYSRWGDPGDDLGQFVAQPFNYPGNIERYDVTFAPGEVTSHAIRWLADRVEYRAWRGGADDEATSPLIHAWTYTGPHVPRPEQPRLHLNLWKLDGTPAAAQEVVFQDVRFVPAGGVTDVAELPAARPALLRPAMPNPFNPRTVLTFALARPGTVTLDVFDLTGRRVRRLVDGALPAGEHRTEWHGRDDHGRTLASGVYLVRLAGDGFVQQQRVTLVK
jgi:hypothetical protein